MDNLIFPLQEKRYQPLIALDKQISRFKRTRLYLLNSVDKQDINLLWENMTQAYGAKFTSSYGYSDNGVWFNALNELTKCELMFGFRYMLKSTIKSDKSKLDIWPPNVREFYAYCKRALGSYNIPTVKMSYLESQGHLTHGTQGWSHPVVFYSALYMGVHAIKEDYWCAKLSIYKNYYLLMSQLFLDGLLPKEPGVRERQDLLSRYAERKVDRSDIEQMGEEYAI